MPDALQLDSLNPDQLDAVVHRGGPLLVVAGAGSGKTRVLTHRIAHLVDEGVPPTAILAITFTNKAAEEMRHRVAALVGSVAKAIWVSTFHSACVRILRAEADALGYPRNFSIYDAADAQRLTGYVIRDLRLDAKRFPPRGAHNQISLWKNELVAPQEAVAKASNPFERKHADIYVEYQARLHKAGAMDFDDLLMKVVELFRDHPDVLAKYQRRFQHILVDEYQDTNMAQNQIALMLASDHRQITIVGDGDQCLPTGTLVRTPDGEVLIEDIAVGDVVLGTGGKRTAHPGTVTVVKEGRFSGFLVRVVAGDASVVGTPHHMLPAALNMPADQHLVYLMYRADRGYRIGRTVSWRRNSRGESEIGLRVRAVQEHADAMWILRVCHSVAEAAFHEARFAAEYGLPTACFHSTGRALALDDGWLEQLFASIDTVTRAKVLMDDLQLHPDHPHHRPQNGRLRRTLNLTMFADARAAVGYHRVAFCSNQEEVWRRLEAADIRTRPAKVGRRVETSFKSYPLALRPRAARRRGRRAGAAQAFVHRWAHVRRHAVEPPPSWDDRACPRW